MFGLIFDCVENCIIITFGKDAWANIISKTFAAENTADDATIATVSSARDGPTSVFRGWVVNKNYPDELFFKIAIIAAEETETPLEALVEVIGYYFLDYIRDRGGGYDDMLRCQGDTLREWVSHTNNFHDHLTQVTQLDNAASQFKFLKIFCSDEVISATRVDPSTVLSSARRPSTTHGVSTVGGKLGASPGKNLLLYYKSVRGDMMSPLIVGIVRRAAVLYFDTTVTLEKLQAQNENGSEFSVWRVLETPTKEQQDRWREENKILIDGNSNSVVSDCSSEGGSGGGGGGQQQQQLKSKSKDRDSDKNSSRASNVSEVIAPDDDEAFPAGAAAVRMIAEAKEAKGGEAMVTCPFTGKDYPRSAVMGGSSGVHKSGSGERGHESTISGSGERRQQDDPSKIADGKSATPKKSSTGKQNGDDENKNLGVAAAEPSSTTGDVGAKQQPPQQQFKEGEGAGGEAKAASKKTKFSAQVAASYPEVGLSGSQLKEIFPFHIVVNQDMVITQFGARIATFLPKLKEGANVNSWFSLRSSNDACNWDWREITLMRRDAVFEIEVLSVRKQGFITLTGKIFTQEVVDEEDGTKSLCIVFLVQPNVHSIKEMVDHKLTWSDFGKYSNHQHIVLLEEHLKSETAEASKAKQEAMITQQSLEAKRLFVRYVSHEIRTPLNTVAMGLELIRTTFEEDTGSSSDKVSEGVLEMVAEVKESCDIAVNILNDLLLYDKLEGGILTLDKHCEPALAVVHEAVRTFGIQAKQAGLELDCSFDSSSFSPDELENPTIFMDVDKPKISQVVRNIVSNAIKFSTVTSEMSSNNAGNKPKVVVHVAIFNSVDEAAGNSGAASGSSGAVSVKQSGSSTPLDGTATGASEGNLVPSSGKSSYGGGGIYGKRLRLEVSDSGPGIATSNQKRLFEEIVQFDPNKLQGGGGSGLGLYISKAIMDLHGGRIGVFSEGEGMGSCFYIDIPIHTADEPCAVLSKLFSVKEDSYHDNLTSLAIQSASGTPRSLASSNGDNSNNTSAAAVIASASSGIILPIIRSLSKKRLHHYHSPNMASASKGALFSDSFMRAPLIGHKGSSGSSHNSFKRQRSGQVITPGASPRGSVSPLSSLIAPMTLRMRRGEHLDKSIVPLVLTATHRKGSSTKNNKGFSIRQHESTVSSVETSGTKRKEGGKYRVLVVDDSLATRKMIVRFLHISKLCDDVVEAADGEEALRLVIDSMERAADGSANEQLFSLVLMDFVMPGMDGPTSASLMRREGFRGPIIGVTGNVLPEDRDFFVNHGANSVMHKPIDMKQLKNLILTCKKEAVLEDSSKGGKGSSSNLTSPQVIVLGRHTPVNVESSSVRRGGSGVVVSGGGRSSDDKAHASVEPRKGEMVIERLPSGRALSTQVSFRSVPRGARDVSVRQSGGGGGVVLSGRNSLRASGRRLPAAVAATAAATTCSSGGMTGGAVGGGGGGNSIRSGNNNNPPADFSSSSAAAAAATATQVPQFSTAPTRSFPTQFESYHRPHKRARLSAIQKSE